MRILDLQQTFWIGILYLTILIPTYAEASNTSVAEIPTVIATATDSDPSTLTIPGNIIRITRQQIQASGATTLAQVLQNQGIQLNDLYGDGSTVTLGMRGFGDNAAYNALILVNGYRLSNPDLRPPDLNSIPLDNIEKIEIIPGSAGVLYGSDAVGGVINIITRKPQHFFADAGISYGSYQQKIYNATLGNAYPNGFNYLITGLKNDTNNYRVHNQQAISNIGTQLGYDYHTGSVFFAYQNFTNNLQYAGALTAAQVQNDRRQAQIDSNFDNEITNAYQTGIKQQLGDDWLLQTQLAHSSTHGNGFIYTPFSEQRRIDNISPRLLGDLDNNLITTGIDLENDRYQFLYPGFNTDIKQRQYSPFTQLVIPLNSSIKFIAGARAAYQNSSGITSNNPLNAYNKAFITEQSISWRLNRTLRLFISRAGNFRFPKADENGSLPIGVTRLKTQTGTSYETGGEWRQEKTLLKLTLYQLRLKNEIAFDPLQTPTQPFGANVNLDPTLRNGLVLSSQYKFNSRLTLNGQYNYVDAHFIAGSYRGNTIPYVAHNLFSIGADYYFIPQLDGYLEYLYTGQRYASADYGNASGKLGGYSVVNTALNYHAKNWTLSARINNLFNKQYNAFTVYSPAVMANYFYPASERNFVITVNYSLG
jgi:iron complex outermembrane recepter protein